MCGRYTLTLEADELAEIFGLADPPDHRPRYNIAPTQPAPVVVRGRDGLRCGDLIWGLVPEGSRGPPGFINARAESAASRRSFRGPFRRRRCVVPADGFYEWRAEAGRKVPYWFELRGAGGVGFAGLWDRWREGSQERVTFTVLTAPATADVARVHDRMPVVLDPQRSAEWLEPEAPVEALSALLLGAAPALRGVPVSNRVNRPVEDDPGLVEPVGNGLDARD